MSFHLMNWHASTVADTLKELGTPPDGLSDSEAQARRARRGANEMSIAPPAPAWEILVAQLRSIIVGLLILAVGVAFASGDPADGAAIAAVLVINVLLGFTTELRGRRAVEALRALVVQRAHVLRNGVVHQIDARDVVPGDIIEIEAGQSVPADARLIGATELALVESALTGESFPVDKRSDAVLATDTPLPDQVNMVLQGTSVVAGRGRAVVVATGMATELGRIGTLVSGIAEERTPLEGQLDALGRRLAAVALVVGALIAFVELWHGSPLSLVLQTGIAVAVAAVPEGLPVVVTVAMAIGVRRMARRRALVRRMPSVETLGSTTVICTDKTGTLTSGEMSVTSIWVSGDEWSASNDAEPDRGFDLVLPGSDNAAHERLLRALHVGALTSRAGLLPASQPDEHRGAPEETALLIAARRAGIDRSALLEQWPQAGELPFSSARMLMATFHRATDGRLEAVVKGAPGRVLARCDRVLTRNGEEPLDESGRKQLAERNRLLGARGLRVLALASGAVSAAEDSALHGLTFVGFAGMIDPPAPGVRVTIQRLREAGIRILMLTGDQLPTAEAIARDLGLLSPSGEVLSGADIDRLSDSELLARVERLTVCSRVSPEAKLRIVSALQRRGEIVAMLGDGVNDAAALKKANIGVAMGRRGTDVAREAAGVVLADDQFSTIAAAVEEGRVIFDNIRRFVFYLFSCNLGEIAVLLGAGVAGLPLPLLPLQLLWLNLLTDTFPALALAFEPAETDTMRQPPRDPRAEILSPRLRASIVWFGLLIGAVALTAFVWGLNAYPDDPRRASTLCFMTLAFAQLFHLGNARSRESVLAPPRALANIYALGALAIGVTLQVFAVKLPSLARVLSLEPLTAADWGLVFLLGGLPAILGQAAKSWRRRSAATVAQRPRSDGVRRDPR